MKSTLLAMVCLFIFSCNTKSGKDLQTTEIQTFTLTAREKIKSSDSIMHRSVTNNTGNTIEQSYNLTNATAVFKVNGESIPVKQDTVASGIQYSNDRYLYKEHRGNIELYKDGRLVWDNIK